MTPLEPRISLSKGEKFMKIKQFLALGAVLVSFPLAAQAQTEAEDPSDLTLESEDTLFSRLDRDDFSVETGLSLSGFYLAPTYQVNDKVSLRLPITRMDFSTSANVEGNSVSSSLTGNTVGIMADYYPRGSGFRISGGFTSGGYAMSAQVDELVFDGVSYSPGGAGLGLGLAEDSDAAFTLTIGLKNTRRNFVFFGDFGVKATTLQLTTSGEELLGGQVNAFRDQIAAINSELSDFKGVLPVIQMGASIGL